MHLKTLIQRKFKDDRGERPHRINRNKCISILKFISAMTIFIWLHSITGLYYNPKTNQTQASYKSFFTWFQYASPAALTLQTLNLSAGTNLDRYVQFEQSVRNAKLDIAKKVEGKVLIGERLTLQEYDNLPAYHFNKQDFRQLLGDISLPIVFLFTLTSLLFYITFHRLTRLTARILE